MKTKSSLFPAALFTALAPITIVVMIWEIVSSEGNGLRDLLIIMVITFLLPASIGFTIAAIQFLKQYLRQSDASLLKYFAFSLLILVLVSTLVVYLNQA